MVVSRDVDHANRNERYSREIREAAAKQDIDALTAQPREQLELRLAQAEERIETRNDRALDAERDLTERERELSKADAVEIEALRAALVRAGQTEARSRELHDAITEARDGQSGHASLLVSEENVRKHAEAIRNGAAYGTIEERAKVTVATHYGSPGSYSDGRIPDPITLRSFANIPISKAEGATAQMPSITLPAGAAGVTEAANHGEFDSAAVVNLNVLRYGRWSDVTSFVDEFDSLSAINQAHAVGIARDLNLLDATAIQTAAGSVTAFDANNLDRNVRSAILKVAAATLSSPEDVVLFGTSAALAVVNGYAPASGSDRGSVTTRVFGARVYVHEAATAGNVYAFNPNAFKVFATGLRSASIISPESGNHRFGSWIHSTPPGVFVVGGAAGVDVVTP